MPPHPRLARVREPVDIWILRGSPVFPLLVCFVLRQIVGIEEVAPTRSIESRDGR